MTKDVGLSKTEARSKVRIQVTEVSLALEPAGRTVQKPAVRENESVSLSHLGNQSVDEAALQPGQTVTSFSGLLSLLQPTSRQQANKTTLSPPDRPCINSSADEDDRRSRPSMGSESPERTNISTRVSSNSLKRHTSHHANVKVVARIRPLNEAEEVQ